MGTWSLRVQASDEAGVRRLRLVAVRVYFTLVQFGLCGAV